MLGPATRTTNFSPPRTASLPKTSTPLMPKLMDWPAGIGIDALGQVKTEFLLTYPGYKLINNAFGKELRVPG